MIHILLPLSGWDDHAELIEQTIASEVLTPPFLTFPFRQNDHLSSIKRVHQSEIEYHFNSSLNSGRVICLTNLWYMNAAAKHVSNFNWYDVVIIVKYKVATNLAASGCSWIKFQIFWHRDDIGYSVSWNLRHFAFYKKVSN